MLSYLKRPPIYGEKYILLGFIFMTSERVVFGIQKFNCIRNLNVQLSSFTKVVIESDILMKIRPPVVRTAACFFFNRLVTSKQKYWLTSSCQNLVSYSFVDMYLGETHILRQNNGNVRIEITRMELYRIGQYFC